MALPAKCLRCGAPLPPVGDCPRCKTAGQAPPPRSGAPTPPPASPPIEGAVRVDRRAPPGLRARGSAAPPPPPTPGFARRPPPEVGPPLEDPEGDEIARHLGSADVGGPRPSPLAGIHTVRQVSSAARPPLELHAEPAPLWRRLGAFGIDAALIAALALLLLALALAVTRRPAEDAAARIASLGPLALALVLLLGFAYGALTTFLLSGRTLGRRAFGLYLVDATGLPPRPLRAMARALLSPLSFALFLGGIWLAVFDRRKQTLHDKLTRTFVVRRL